MFFNIFSAYQVNKKRGNTRRAVITVLQALDKAMHWGPHPPVHGNENVMQTIFETWGHWTTGQGAHFLRRHWARIHVYLSFDITGFWTVIFKSLQPAPCSQNKLITALMSLPSKLISFQFFMSKAFVETSKSVLFFASIYCIYHLSPSYRKWVPLCHYFCFNDRLLISLSIFFSDFLVGIFVAILLTVKIFPSHLKA